MEDLFTSIQQLKESTQEEVIYGSLGIPLSGQKVVEVPGRSGFVYVRLRDSISEIIQAQNDAVSPVYNLPVILTRVGNRYTIKGRDVERYQDWGSFSSFVPRHAEQHEFNPDNGGSGDKVFIYGRQFMPLLTTPSGSAGAGNVVLAGLNYQNDTFGWMYVGNTGTQNLLTYKPTDSSAVMVLVYLDTLTGNPNILVGSGSYFANGITGTAEVTPYIPAVSNPRYVPSAAIRLSSGTSVIGWDNIYDAKQYYAPIVTGTSSGSSVPLFITGSVPYAGSNGILKEQNNRFYFREDLGILVIGNNDPGLNITSDQGIRLFSTGSNSAIGVGMFTVGTGTLGSPAGYANGYRARGSWDALLPVKRGDAVWANNGFGFNGVDWVSIGRFRMYANDDLADGVTSEGRMEWDLVPSGTIVRRNIMSLYGDSLNLSNSGTYNINGVPHTHSLINLLGILSPANGGTGISNTGTVTNHNNTVITGGGAVALGGFTLTIPASLTAAGLGIANVFTAQQKITVPTTTTTGLILQSSDNNTTNNLLEIQGSTGTSQTRINGVGALVVKPSVASTAIFAVQNTSGGNLFRVDTTNGFIRANEDPGVTTFPLLVGTSQTPAVGTSGVIRAVTAVDIMRYEASATAAAVVTFIRGKGTITSPTAVGVNDRIGGFIFSAYHGSGIINSANFGSIVELTYTGTAVPQALFFSAGNSATPPERVRITSGGSLLIGTTTDGLTASGSLAIAQDLDHRGTKVTFYGGTLRDRASALTTQVTTLTHTNPGTPDYAVQDFVDVSLGAGWAFKDHDEANSVLKALANLQIRVAEIEAGLNNATGVNLFE